MPRLTGRPDAECVYKGLVQVDVLDRKLQRMLDKPILTRLRRVKIGFIQHELQFSI